MKSRAVDLSHVLIPSRMNRELEVKLMVGDTRPWGSDDPAAGPIITEHPVDQRDSVPVPDGYYFLMSDIKMNSHAGTHIEIPFHCLKGQKDFTEYPLERLYGPGVFLRLRDYPPESAIELDDVKHAAATAGGIRHEDMVFIETGYDRYFFEDSQLYLKAPYPSYDAMQWIVGHKIKIFGMDSGFIERPRNPRHDNHLLILESGAALIENMTKLGQVAESRAMIYCFPIAIKGADSMQVRIVAIQEEVEVGI